MNTDSPGFGRFTGRVLPWAPVLAAVVWTGCGGRSEPAAAAAQVEVADGHRTIRHTGLPARSAWVARSDGGRLLFRNGAPAASPGWSATSATEGSTYEARPVREFRLAAVRAREPLIRIRRGGEASPAGVGVVEVPASALLGELANTGWVAADEEGGVFFAHALRPEVRRYDREGRLEWRSLRPVAVPVTEPELAVEDGTVAARFSEIQHGIATGPDGRVYIMTAGPDPDSLRLDVLTRDGSFVATSTVPARSGVAVDRAGEVYVRAEGEDPDEEAGRARFASFDLPALDGTHRIRLGDQGGTVYVVNFWASWCAPCRREMPRLDTLARDLGGHGLVVIGLNEDRQPEEARAFVREIGGVSYPLAAGQGRLRERYHYRGLPLTVVLDARLGVVVTQYGFGDDLGALREVVERELSRAGPSRSVHDRAPRPRPQENHDAH